MEKAYSNAGSAGAPQASDPFADKLSDFHRAKIDFDAACHRVAEANQSRAQAEKRLAMASKVISELTANALNDPTVPQCQTDAPYPTMERPSRY